LGAAPGRVRCELGVWHEGDHAAYVWDQADAPRHALWVRWNPDGDVLRFENLHWCEVDEPISGDNACTLYREHASGHSWSLRDPDTEALDRQVRAENAGWLKQFAREWRQPDPPRGAGVARLRTLPRSAVATPPTEGDE